MNEITKRGVYLDGKRGKLKHRAGVTKNEVYSPVLSQGVANHINDENEVNFLWYASADNLRFVKHDLKRLFVMSLKTKRKVAPSAV